MFSVCFFYETCIKTILSLIGCLISEALLVADHVSIRCCFNLLTSLNGFWQTRSCMSVSVGVSRLWCTRVVFMQPGVNVNGAYYCDVLLLKQLLPDMSQASGDFCFAVHHACARALTYFDTRLRTSHQTCGLPIDQTCSVDYRVLTAVARDIKHRWWAVVINTIIFH